MKIPLKNRRKKPIGNGLCQGSAFTLIEVLVSAVLLGIISISLFTCFSTSFAVMESAREDLRATQILLQQTEAIRLCTWSQLTNVTFKASYDPTITSTNTRGVVYYGTLTTNAASDIPTSMQYQTNLCLVTVTLTWTNWTLKRPVAHTRTMQTQVAKYGMQNYLWGYE